MEDDSSLSFYINRLYAAFSGYRDWKRENICSDCLTQSDLRILASKDLEDLSEGDLQKYARSVHILLLAFGQVEDP
jgi:hypothetical protein